jgi:hypothetical protein
MRCGVGSVKCRSGRSLENRTVRKRDEGDDMLVESTGDQGQRASGIFCTTVEFNAERVVCAGGSRLYSYLRNDACLGASRLDDAERSHVICRRGCGACGNMVLDEVTARLYMYCKEALLCGAPCFDQKYQGYVEYCLA